jgi:amidase
MTDIAFRSATELSAALRDMEISSRELLDLYLARYEELNPRLNAVVTLDEERARAQATEADNALARGEVRGPLHGLPMTVKDAYEVAGVRTTGGDPAHAEHVPATDADAVARLRAAGAIIFGKTNMSEQGADWQTFNQVFGCTNNPWDEERTPGGSSGGSAVALAAGLSAFELGSDIAGSLRIPAHNCGVYGMKTSQGIISQRGHIPGEPGRLSPIDLVVMGPMGRSAEDLDLGLDVLTGAEGGPAKAWALDLPAPRRPSLADYRIAAWLDDPYCTIDREVLEVLESAAATLRAAGVEVVHTQPPVPLEEGHRDLYQPLFMAVAAGMFADEVFNMMLQFAEGDPTGDEGEIARIAQLITARVRDWHTVNERRYRAAQRWAEFFTDYDALLCPVAPTIAIPHDHNPDMSQRSLTINGEKRRYDEQMIWTGMVNASFLPSVAAPVGLSRTGLPVGVQIVAPYLEDRTAVDIARRLADLVGGFVPPPGL